MSEYVRYASDIGKKIILANCQVQEGSGKPGLVRRAVDFPSLMLSLGFSPAFTFYVSKVENYHNVLAFYQTIKGNSSNTSIICSELEKKESTGYAGYIGILLTILEKIGKKMGVINDPIKLYSYLMDITNEVEVKDERLILPYLNEIKKVLEALPYG
jgi:CRISPR type III-B/RAMP module-associated protein Cmr5